MSKAKSAVIGVGGIGKWHTKMQHDTGRLEVVAVCDSNPAHREWAAKDFPQARYYTDVDEMLAKERPALVSVVTPHNLHAPIAIKCLEAGASVVTEKPMATRYEDALAMVAAAKKHGRFVSVFHNRRLDPWFLAAKSAIDSGLLGRVIEISTGINYGPTAATWRGFKEASGGLQFDWGAHLVDYVLHFVDSPVRSVSGFLYTSPDKPKDQVEDHAVTNIRFECGTIAHITSAGKGTVQPQRYRIIGEKGTLVDDWSWSDQGAAKLHTRVNGFPAVIDVPYQKRDTQEYYNNVAEHLLDGKPLMVTGESAAKVINVLCTAERSAAQGGTPLPLA